jgi:hypothetical protein
MTIKSGKGFEDVLDEMLAGRSAPTADAVAIWAALYPEHRTALIEFAASWAEDTHLPVARTDEARQRSVVATAIDKFRSATAPVAPTTLSALAASAGTTMEGVAQGLGIDTSVVAKLNARRIEPRSIGGTLASRIAKLLHVDVAAVVATWSGAPAPLGAAAFLARSASVRRETLREALIKVGTPACLVAELESGQGRGVD